MHDRALIDRRERFHDLHASGCFIVPNPWDEGSARALVALGFTALATTSSGFAWSTGRLDHQVPLEDMLGYVGRIASAVDVPVSADFEGGFAVDADAVAANVLRAAATGLAGLSIEDSTGDAGSPLFDFDHAVARIAAVRRAIDASESRLLLTARSEGFVVGRPDLDETIRRLAAFAEAGADCLFAPGIRSTDQIASIVAAVAPKPVNVLVNLPFATVDSLAALGVRRISVGGALARAAWAGFLRAAREIADHGTFASLADAASASELGQLFTRK